jgi:hypothetical protein
MLARVGVDVSKHHLDWTVGEDGPVHRLPNTPAGIHRLVARAGPGSCSPSSMPCCGIGPHGAKPRHEEEINHGCLLDGGPATTDQRQQVVVSSG